MAAPSVPPFSWAGLLVTGFAIVRRRFALVYNATAGLAVPRLLDGVLVALKAAGAEVVHMQTRSAEDARSQVAHLAHNGGADAVIAAGGDGTFRAVAAGAAGGSTPVGFIPLGTGNVLGHELGLKRKPAALAQGLLSDPAIEVHAGLANGEPFFLMTGAGFDADIVARLNYRLKRMLGRAAYGPPVLSALGTGPRMFDVVLDGHHTQASWVIISRASRYGGSFVLTRDAAVGRSAMVAVVVRARTRRQLMQAATALALGRLSDARTRPAFVEVVPVERAVLGEAVHVPVEVDGDEAGRSPVTVEAHGPTVRVIVPETYALRVSSAH